MFCEASAYGIPSITNNVCGVGQVIQDKKNGILLSLDTPTDKWGEIIIDYFNDKQLYREFRKKSFIEFKERLNWNVWLKKVNDILYKVQNWKSIKFPTYIMNAVSSTFFAGDFYDKLKKKPEFNIKSIDVCLSNLDMNRSLWTYITESVNHAKRNDEKYMIICCTNSYFTDRYSYSFLLQKIKDAQKLKAEVLVGGLSDFRQAIPMGYQLYWIAIFKNAPFIIIYKSLYEKILSYRFKSGDKIDDVLSLLAKYKMVIYPFICIQKSENKDNQIANEKLKRIDCLYKSSKFNFYK